MILQVLAVCLSGLYREQTYHSYPQKVSSDLLPQILQANDEIYHDLQR